MCTTHPLTIFPASESYAFPGETGWGCILPCRRVCLPGFVREGSALTVGCLFLDKFWGGGGLPCHRGMPCRGDYALPDNVFLGIGGRRGLCCYSVYLALGDGGRSTLPRGMPCQGWFCIASFPWQWWINGGCLHCHGVYPAEDECGLPY